MSVPASREQLKNWCLRDLGWPVVEINVDDDQVEDRIDQAFQFFNDFHFDGVEKVYTKYQLTQTDIDNQFIPITDAIVGITRIFPFSQSMGNRDMFGYKYEFRLNDLYDFTSSSYVNYAITMQHLRMLEILFVGEAPIRFNRHTNKLYIDWNWAQSGIEGKYIIIEGYAITDPDTYSKVYNDRMLKKLATAYIKKQWGTNMKKFEGMKLPGGVLMNGQKIYDEAVAEIKEIEDDIEQSYQAPPAMLVQ